MDIDGRLLGSPQWNRLKELHTKAYKRFLWRYPFSVTNNLSEDDAEEYKSLLNIISLK